MARKPKPVVHCRIVTKSIEVPKLTAMVSGVTNGGVCVFIGQVREASRGRKVVRLEYDAFVPMAEKQLKKIAEEAQQRWGADVAIEHRLGKMELGEASVVVCVGSPHRAEAFEACRWCIDTLKQDVPIWKKEICPDGSFWIEGEEAVQSK